MCLIKRITENGIPCSHIVLAARADELLTYAAEELAYHIKKISGADIPVMHEVREGSLPIIIATPDTYPELETLFPEDLAWLRTLSEENGRCWGADGFAVRLYDGKIYIFGVVSKGAMNGMYDFMEKNMGIIWVRANDDYGTIYKNLPTLSVTKVNYREKSPFAVRGWHMCALNDNNPANHVLLGRSKMNAKSRQCMKWIGINPLRVNHNVKDLVKNSSIYDPTVEEYWNTLPDGTYSTYETSTQINFFSDITAEAVAASIIDQLETGETYPFIGIEDYDEFGRNANHDNVSFEYAPGQFVDSSEVEYKATVYFTFINKVARLVKAAVPDGKIATFAYYFTEQTPKCELEDNVLIIMATIRENLAFAYNDFHSANNSLILSRMEAWRAKGAKMVFYNYYGCFRPSDHYTRPVWDRIKEYLCYYRDCGYAGLLPEGVGDDGTPITWYYCGVRHEVSGHNDYYESNDSSLCSPNSYVWDLNGMTFWIYAKLTWNPDCEVDDLIVEYCDKVYGAASAVMQEYYRLVKLGWDAGRDDLPFEYQWGVGWTHVMECFLFNKKFDEDPSTANLMGRILSALNTAMKLADERAKNHIRPILERMENACDDYKQFLMAYPDAEIGTHTPSF